MAESAKQTNYITDRRLIRQLQSMLQKECKLYAEFIGMAREQRKWIVKFNADKIEALNRRRKELHRMMQAIQAERLIIMQQFPDSQGRRLSSLIADYCVKEDQKALLPLVEQLRALVVESQKIGSESNHVVQFALNVINGSLTIFWQATQCVTKAYGRNARVQKSYAPRSSRDETVLKQA